MWIFWGGSLSPNFLKLLFLGKFSQNLNIMTWKIRGQYPTPGPMSSLNFFNFQSRVPIVFTDTDSAPEWPRTFPQPFRSRESGGQRANTPWFQSLWLQYRYMVQQFWLNANRSHFTFIYWIKSDKLINMSHQPVIPSFQELSHTKLKFSWIH